MENQILTNRQINTVRFFVGVMLVSLIIAGVIFSLLFFRMPDLFNAKPVKKVTLGAWTQGFFDGSNKKLHPEKLLEFENLVDKKFSIAHYYIGWESLADPDLINQFETLRTNEWQPMLNVNPYFFDKCPAGDLPIYQEIAQGKCDEFLREAGKNLSKLEKPFYLVFAWEMNNHNNQWGVVKSGSDNEDFVLAWQRMHDIFKEEGAGNILWVFCPNVPEEETSPYDKIYPGDAYVDWVGLDGYNWGTTQSWSQWAGFAGVFGKSYQRITTVAPNKPLMIAEVNTTDQGGDKASWYRDMFVSQIPENFPKIEAVVIFNEDKTVTEKVNWKVDVTPQSLEAFKSAIGSEIYN